jgi:DNA-directed RNA polymerase specialized sigma subunit
MPTSVVKSASGKRNANPGSSTAKLQRAPVEDQAAGRPAKHRHKPKRPTLAESRARAERMAELRGHDGLTLSEIGETYGVSRQFVHQVLKARGERLRRVEGE